MQLYTILIYCFLFQTRGYVLRATLCSVCIVLFASLAWGVRTCRADVLDIITLNTAPLVGDSAGPFSIAFELIDGSGTGDGNNTATLSDFQFGGGGPSGTPVVFGGTSGDLSSTVTLTDSSFLNFFIQQFTAGDSLSFHLRLTTNVDAGPTPDGFSFSILDNTDTEIPTQGGPFFDVFLNVDINSSTPTIETFASDPTLTPAAGGPPIDIAAPQVTPVPEPGTWILIGSASFILLGIRWRNQRRLASGS